MQQSAVGMFPRATLLLKLKRSWSVRKQVVASFFLKPGHIATMPLPDICTVQCWVVQLWRNWKERPLWTHAASQRCMYTHCYGSNGFILAINKTQLVSIHLILQTSLPAAGSCSHMPPPKIKNKKNYRKSDLEHRNCCPRIHECYWHHKTRHHETTRAVV